jgi:hypothetical protein
MDGGLWVNSTRPPVSDEVLPSPDLNDREHRKDHLSGETDRSGERSVGGKLIHERSTEHGTRPDLSRHRTLGLLASLDIHHVGDISPARQGVLFLAEMSELCGIR